MRVWYNAGVRIFNKNFYRFLFSFVSIIAVALLVILVVGIGSK